MPKRLIQWQKPMVRVLTALIPVMIGSVYFFGWRALLLLACVNAVAFLTEYAFTRTWNQSVSSAVFVSATLFTLSLPPPIPFWMAGVGGIFGILFGKMVFGGFGRNIFNPALTGRAFIYVCFGAYMTAQWSDPLPGPAGGFAAYAMDAITTATPGMLLKTQTGISWQSLFWGRCAGTLGGTSAFLALLGGIYLLWTRTANYRIVLSGTLGYLLCQGLLWYFEIGDAVQPLYAMLGGSFVIGILFYATDPVSASQTNPGRWLYGAFIGILSSLISVFSAWPAGTMFAILLANMFAPITDHVIREYFQRPAATREEKTGP